VVRVIGLSSALALGTGCLPSVPGPSPSPPETGTAAATIEFVPSVVAGPIEIMQRSDALEWPIFVTDAHLFTTERVEYGGARRIMRSALEAQGLRTEVFRAKDARPSRAGSGFVTIARDDDDITRAAHVDPTGKVTRFGLAEQVAWDAETGSVVIARPPAEDGSFDIVTASLATPTEERTLATVRDPRFTEGADSVAVSPRGIAFGVRPRDAYLDPRHRPVWGVFFLAKGAAESTLVAEVPDFFRVDFLERDLLVTRLAYVDVGAPARGSLAPVPQLMWDNLVIDGDVVYGFVTLTNFPDALHPGSSMFAWRRGERPVEVPIDIGKAITLSRAHVYWLDDTTHTVKRTPRLPGF
jgi:hypothetical protein